VTNSAVTGSTVAPYARARQGGAVKKRPPLPGDRFGICALREPGPA
jgi:hypothetical protein